MSPQSILITAALSALAGYVVGYFAGMSRGRAAGWCERYFEQAEKDRARRDRAGRFCAQRKEKDRAT